MKHYLKGLIFSLFFLEKVFAISPNTVTYKITFDPYTLTYTVWLTPNYSTPNAYNTGNQEMGATAQVLIAVPRNFSITNVTDIVGEWDKTPLKLDSSLPGLGWISTISPNLSYYVIAKSVSSTVYGKFTKDTAIALFSFKGNSCFGPIKIVDNADAIITAANANALNIACSFYSRSGQPPIVSAIPEEQFVSVLGTPAYCSSEFYVGGKFCIEDNTMGTTPPSGSATVSSNCSSPTIFFDGEPASNAWYWDFGDGTSSGIRNPTHQYKTAGTYPVTLVRTIGTAIQSPETKTITIGTFPDQPLFNKKKSADTSICDKQRLKLDPYYLRPAPSGVTYLWAPNGETTPTIEVTKSGCYSVEVFNATTGCSRTAKINVKICLQAPPQTGSSEKWYFGQGATLDFKFEGDTVAVDSLLQNGSIFDPTKVENISYSPTSSPNASNNVNVSQGTAMVYDPTGSLKYYTDGRSVWSGQNEVIPFLSGDTLISATNTLSQGVLLVPKNSCNECPHHQYYLFRVDANTKILSYSVIDTRYNNGKGAIIERDVPVAYPVTERINAMITKDSTGFMIVAHEAGTNNFNIITIDSTGLRQTTQGVGDAQNAPESQKGYVAMSPVGDKIAQGVVINNKNYVEIYDFDRATGKLSNLRRVDLGIAAPPEVYGVAFNDHADLLYVTIKGDPTLGQSSYIYQLNLNLSDATQIAATKNLIVQSNSVMFGAIQEGPLTATNGKKYMYVAVNNSPKLPYIQDPNTIGNGSLVGYVPVNNGVEIGTISKLGFPTIIKAKPKEDGDGFNATYSGNCQFSPTVFEIQEVCSPMKNKVEWKLDGGLIKLSGKQVSHTFTKEGWHRVEVRVSILSTPPTSKVINSQILNSLLSSVCEDTLIVDSIYIKPAPQFSLNNNIIACFKEGVKVNLTPTVKGGNTFSYLWSPMSLTTPSYQVSAPGSFSLEVTNEFLCRTKTDIKSTDACEPRVTVPEAFSPNGDGLNDDLEINYAHITDFHLKIFNRWGDMIFESIDPEKKWAGTINGAAVMVGVYPYVIEYKSSDFPNRGTYTMRGFVMVLK